MKAHTPRLELDTYYHIYNRGVNGTNIFREEKNYPFFLQKYTQYITPVADTYAYCFMMNHFHLLIKTAPEEKIRSEFPEKDCIDADKIISLQFAHLFNSYAQAFNKVYQRTGLLFETPFRRIPVTREEYGMQVIYYIHANPGKHHFTANFRLYPYSSYQTYLSEKPALLKREQGLSMFGGKERFIEFHERQWADAAWDY